LADELLHHLIRLLDKMEVQVQARVARWYIFRPKIAIWVNFEGPCKGRC
jgi:hypothetical protein